MGRRSADDMREDEEKRIGPRSDLDDLQLQTARLAAALEHFRQGFMSMHCLTPEQRDEVMVLVLQIAATEVDFSKHTDFPIKVPEGLR